MYTEKIRILEDEILQIKKAIKASKKEIKKREKIVSMVVDEEVETEIEMYKEDIEAFENQLKTKKELIRNYKKL